MTGIPDGHIIPNDAHAALFPGSILLNKGIQALDEGRPMPIHGQHIGNLGAQAVINLNLPASGLAKNRHLYAIAKPTGALTHQQVYILYIGIGSDGVISHVIGHILYEGIVPYRYVVKGGVPQSRVLSDASRQGKHVLKAPKPHSTGEADVAYVVQGFGM
jgi:hypothetical protein